MLAVVTGQLGRCPGPAGVCTACLPSVTCSCHS
jgi:hypothetical protein